MASTRCRRRGRAAVVGACAVVLAAMLAGFLAKGASIGVNPSCAEDSSSATGGAGAAPDAAQTGEWASEPPAGLGEALASEEGTLSERVVDADLPDAASGLLEEYEREPGTLLARSGWLDLAGRVWGCVVMGPGWVDVCLLSDGLADGQTCVKALRMEVSEWRDSHVEAQEVP